MPARAVGRNLQDHISAAVAYARRSPGPIRARLRADRILLDLARCLASGTGIASEFVAPVMAFLRTGATPALDQPDIQFFVVAAPIDWTTLPSATTPATRRSSAACCSTWPATSRRG